MRFTSQQNLPCLEDTDMAAVALYMQCLAEQVEDTLVATQAEFTSFLDAPVAIWTNTAIQTAIPNFGNFTFNSVSSNNWPTVPSPTSPSLPNVRGWYYIGANVNVIDLTVPTVNEPRAAILTATQNFGTIGSPVLAEFTDTVFESNTGNGENVLPAGTVFFAGGEFTVPDPVALNLQYRTGPGILDGQTTLTPPIRLWAIYLGDTPQIGVV